MKEKFYIFLDIDGVLFDLKYIEKVGYDKFDISRDFDPKSIFALNYLIAELRKNYDVELVISSSWRANMKKTLEALINNGVVLDYLNVSRTDISSSYCYRGKEIINFLKDKKNKENYVIIDDEMFDFEECFSLDRIIKTDINISDLNEEMVDKFLNNERMFKENKKR